MYMYLIEYINYVSEIYTHTHRYSTCIQHVESHVNM